MIRVVLVDDQRAVRQGLQLRLGLEPDLAVVDETGSAEEALVLAQALLPDVIVVDLQVQGTDGMDSLKRLREVAPAAAMIVLTLYGDGDTRTQAQMAGAHASIEKQGGAESLLETIRGLGRRAPGGRAVGSSSGTQQRQSGEARYTTPVRWITVQQEPLAKRRLDMG